MTTARRWILAAAVIGMAASLAPAQAQGYKYFELYGGYYIPGLDELDNDTTLGLRFGGRVNENFGWEISGGFFDLNGEEDRPLAGTVGDANAYLVDGSVVWYVMGSNFGLLGGIGFGTVNVDLVGSTQDESDDAFTYHGAVFYRFDIGDKFYLRPEFRVRQFEGDTYEKTDTEYTLGFGWKF